MGPLPLNTGPKIPLKLQTTIIYKAESESLTFITKLNKNKMYFAKEEAFWEVHIVYLFSFYMRLILLTIHKFEFFHASQCTNQKPNPKKKKNRPLTIHIYSSKNCFFFNRIFQLYLNLNSILVYCPKYIVLS